MCYLSKDFLRQNELNILISNIFVISIFILFKNSLIHYLNYIPHFCLFDKIFGVECPVCGITRSFCEIAKGNLKQAFSLNLSGFFVALFFLLQIPLRIISLYNIKSIEKVNIISNYLSKTVLMVILINWVVKILMY